MMRQKTELSLVPVTDQNRVQAERLQVFPEQSGFIETVAECMREADELSLWKPVVIMHGTEMIGFSMYGYFASQKEERLWFDRLLIDRNYQHRGYGKHAIPMILGEMRRQYPQENIFLSVYEDNETAIKLYRSFGFRFNGDVDLHGEKVMVLDAQTELPVY